MYDNLSYYLPNNVKKTAYPPSKIDEQNPIFKDCSQNLGNFDKKESPNKPYSLRRKVIAAYLEIDPKTLRVHSCPSHPLCINPTHLTLQKLKSFLPTKKSDGSHGNAKLNKKQVAEIRNLLLTTEISQKEIAKRYGISSMNVILSNKIWKV